MAELREKFDRDGYVVIDFQLSEAILDGVVVDTTQTPVYADLQCDGTYPNGSRVQDHWKASRNVRALATHPTILQTLEELFGRSPLPFQTLNFPVGTEQSIHSDTIHFNSMPAGYMCGVWVALEDIDMNNGPLTYYPGSHKLPEITMDDVEGSGNIKRRYVTRFVDSLRSLVSWRGGDTSGMTVGTMTDGKTYADYERLIEDVIAKAQLEPDYGIMNKGQALIWAANLLHGGAPHTDRRRTRHSQVTHYFFQNCQYYTPLFSRGTKIQWRNPNWISAEADAARELSIPAA